MPTDGARVPSGEGDGGHDHSSQDAADPRCACGHGLDHHMVSESPQYTAWGTFCVLFMGITADPVRIDYQCRVCKEILRSTDDKTVLRQYR